MATMPELDKAAAAAEANAQAQEEVGRPRHRPAAARPADVAAPQAIIVQMETEELRKQLAVEREQNSQMAVVMEECVGAAAVLSPRS